MLGSTGSWRPCQASALHARISSTGKFFSSASTAQTSQATLPAGYILNTAACCSVSTSGCRLKLSAPCARPTSEVHIAFHELRFNGSWLT